MRNVHRCLEHNNEDTPLSTYRMQPRSLFKVLEAVEVMVGQLELVL